MSQFSLLKFMRRKAKNHPDDIVAEKDGKKLTLLQVYDGNQFRILFFMLHFQYRVGKLVLIPYISSRFILENLSLRVGFEKSCLQNE
jgi:hypothetical protein